jgi:hypothetical protein
MDGSRPGVVERLEWSERVGQPNDNKPKQQRRIIKTVTMVSIKSNIKPNIKTNLPRIGT